MSAIRLLAVADWTQRGVSFNRFASLEMLAETRADIAVRIRGKTGVSPYDLEWADVVYVLRAVNADDLAFVQRVKLEGKKVWIDSDDDLLRVPLDHPAYFDLLALAQPYREIHRIADHVTFSTEEMAKSIAVKASSVIPCSYPDSLIEKYTREWQDTNKTVIWRGTHTHEKSLRVFENEIVAVLNAHPDWRIEFFGWKPWSLIERINNPWYVHGFMDVEEMLKRFHELRPAVHIQPRHADAFTLSRSSVSYVEATFGGAVTVAPDWWRLPGALNYTSDFAAKFEEAILTRNAPEHKGRWHAAVEFIKDNRSWSATNAQHEMVLRGL